MTSGPWNLPILIRSELVTGHALPAVRIPDSAGGIAPNQFNSSALPEVRSHFHHRRVGLNRKTETHGGKSKQKLVAESRDMVGSSGSRSEIGARSDAPLAHFDHDGDLRSDRSTGATPSPRTAFGVRQRFTVHYGPISQLFEVHRNG
jgi:hypothetical protein